MVMGSPALRGFDQQRTLFQVAPQAQFQGGAADGIGHWPTEQHLEILVGFADQPSAWRVSSTMFGHRWNRVAKALFRMAEGVFTVALVGDLADHPDHAPPSGFVGNQAAADFAASAGCHGPLDAVVHGAVERLSGEHRMKAAHHPRTVLRGQQVEVVEVLGQRLARVKAE